MSAAATETQATQPETESGHAKPAKVSHGRGGAANIGADDTVYLDGGIVREGFAGDQGDGPHSTGRGGHANIGTPKVKATAPADQEVIPETALRDDRHEVFHTGRGGEGNLHHEDSRTDGGEKKTAHNGKHHDHGDQGATVTPDGETSSAANSTKAKKRLSFFSRKKQTSDSNEAETGQEKDATEASEQEKKDGAPTHNGLGDKLKYKIFGKLYD